MNEKSYTFAQMMDWMLATRRYPQEGAKAYAILGLTGEAGEIANKYKKDLRGDIHPDKYAAHVNDIIDEVGDVLWYCAAICHEFGYTLDDAVRLNLYKLSLRTGRTPPT